MRYLVFGDDRITTIRSEQDMELHDVVPHAAGRTIEVQYDLPNYTGKHFSVLVFLIFFTVLNFCGVIFRLEFSSFWFWGMVAIGIVSFVVSSYLTPMPSDERNLLLEDFTSFEALSNSEKRKSGTSTFLIVVGIWVLGVLSFAYYLNSILVTK
jgi:hypothetical protein